MGEVATSGPVASKFIFIHELMSLAPGTKVRLLGCIVEYDITKGQILLEHAYPKDAYPIPSIWVDISLVLENTNPTSLAPGTWINVIGYVRGTLRQTRRKSGSHFQSAAQAGCLQAVLIWDAGAVRIGDYEQNIEEQRLVRRESDLTGI